MVRKISSDPLLTPVLLLIFNRPQTTLKVFESIRQARPSRLFIAADGPRDNYPDDKLKCQEARNIAKNIDWNCDVKTLFQENNLGCGKAPAKGITWFFQHVSEGIILEDDCLPSPQFFTFCSELLARYRFDKRVMEIGGMNLITELCQPDEDSYYFSQHNHTWAWATWKRAWDLYDYTMARYDETILKEFLKNSFGSQLEYAFFKKYFDETFCNHDRITWWDYQWEFARRINSGLSAVPKSNLIINLGIGADATHTLDPKGTGFDLKWEEISFPLRHPEFISVNRTRDLSYFRKIFTTFPARIKFVLKKMMDDVNGKFAEMI